MKPIQEIIDYLESTPEESWCTDVVRVNDKNCVFGHLYNLGGSSLCDFFEARWATTYMLFPVNDGEVKEYNQPSPKLRCVAYLKDLMEGKAKSTIDLVNEYERSHQL